MNKWRSDLSVSRKDFIEIIWPKIKFWFGDNCQLIQVEEVQDSYAELLDKEAGIDYLIKDEIGIRPISARVQRDFFFETVTIRKNRITGSITELDKLIKRVHSNYLYPWRHIQGYLDTKKFSNIPVIWRVYSVEMADLVLSLSLKNLKIQSYSNGLESALLLPGYEKLWYDRSVYDGNIFRAFEVKKLKELNYSVLEFNQEEECPF